jgi:glycosyltransferase involved in cell wall biosynthesis
MSKVSVVIPNYNHAGFLCRRIDSVLEQSFRDLEIILLDDGSTDASRDILSGYEKQHACIRCRFNETNSGSPFAQWNRGVDLAQGEYVWIAESDDWALPGYLSRMVAMLDELPNVGIAYCLSLIANELGEITGDYLNEFERYDPELWKHDFYMKGREFVANYMSVANVIPNASAAVFRREVYLRAGPADPSFRLSGDRMQWMKMLMLSDVVYGAEPFSVFRCHPTTARATHAGWRQAKEKMLNYDYAARRVRIPSAKRSLALSIIRQIWKGHLREISSLASSQLIWMERYLLAHGCFRAAVQFGSAWVYEAVRKTLVALSGARIIRRSGLFCR